MLQEESDREGEKVEGYLDFENAVVKHEFSELQQGNLEMDAASDLGAGLDAGESFQENSGLIPDDIRAEADLINLLDTASLEDSGDPEYSEDSEDSEDYEDFEDYEDSGDIDDPAGSEDSEDTEYFEAPSTPPAPPLIIPDFTTEEEFHIWLSSHANYTLNPSNWPDIRNKSCQWLSRR